jgi:molybdopterin-guanine dinucleotide biosynthesis protein A
MIISKDSEKFDFENKQHRFINDFTDKQTPLAGIITALKNAKYQKVFIVSADTPFLKIELVKYLEQYTTNYDIVLTVVNGKINTLCGFYDKKALDIFVEGFEKGKFKILNNFENLDVLYIEDINEIKKFDSDLLSFININTEEDFEYAKRITEEFDI